jgi:sigma-E factor negative regulatory protein RseC
MAIEQGIVKEIKGNKVLIETEPAAGCDSCPMNKKCVVVAEDSRRNLWALSSIQLEQGERVEFTIEGKNLFYTSVLIYLIPAILLLIGAVLGASLSDLWGLDKDLRAFLGGSLFFLCSWFMVRLISSRMEKSTASMPLVIKKLPPCVE